MKYIALISLFWFLACTPIEKAGKQPVFPEKHIARDTFLVKLEQLPRISFQVDKTPYNLFVDTFPRNESIHLEIRLRDGLNQLCENYTAIPRIKSHKHKITRLTNNSFHLIIYDTINCSAKLRMITRITYSDKIVGVIDGVKREGKYYNFIQDTILLESSTIRLDKCLK
jgi:hypothetical protein